MRTEMRLGTALRMGSFLVPEPIGGDISACGITMALKCVGYAVNTLDPRFDPIDPYRELVARWPWLSNIGWDVRCPSCMTPLPVQLIGIPVELYGASLVFHPFDQHVMGPSSLLIATAVDLSLLPKQMTIEQLADWIESIDPTPRETSQHIEQPTDLQTFLEAVNTKA